MLQLTFMLTQKRSSTWLVLVALAFASGGAGWGLAKLSETPPTADIDVLQPTTGEGSRVATIEQIRSNPNEFSGKRVRLAGRLSECYSWECSLCPEDMKSGHSGENRCLPLSFRPLVSGTGFGSAEQEDVFRFSSVVLTATFDPACWEDPCLDRQTVLFDADVVGVTEWRAGALGLWLGNTTKLHELNGPEASEMKDAAYRAGYPENPPIMAFATGGSVPRFVICWSSPSFDDQNPGAWPSYLESALYAQSTRDFFECNEVRRVGGQMVLQAGT